MVIGPRFHFLISFWLFVWNFKTWVKTLFVWNDDCVLFCKSDHQSKIICEFTITESSEPGSSKASVAESARAKYGDNTSPLKEFDPAMDGNHGETKSEFCLLFLPSFLPSIPLFNDADCPGFILSREVDRATRTGPQALHYIRYKDTDATLLITSKLRDKTEHSLLQVSVLPLAPAPRPISLRAFLITGYSILCLLTPRGSMPPLQTFPRPASSIPVRIDHVSLMLSSQGKLEQDQQYQGLTFHVLSFSPS